MAVSVDLPDDYALSFIVIGLYTVYLMWCGMQVIKARQKFGVKLPTPYENKEDSVFNRYQRVHANGVESVANFYALLLISALTTPRASAFAGFVFLVGRVLYALGYYTAPENRSRGGFYLLGLMYLLGGTFYTSFKLLTA